MNTPTAMFSAGFSDRLAEVLHESYTHDLVDEVLGPVGRSALQRADLSGVERLTRDGSPVSTFIRLFLLGLGVSPAQARAALGPKLLDQAYQEGLLAGQANTVSALLDVRPYAETGGPPWWVVSDLSTDVRPGPVDAEHVLGVGSAGITLAQAVVRTPAATAADIGTGCGLQALHLARHCSEVTATDVSRRALALAATNARLNDQQWQLRHGSFLRPLGTQQFDLLVCNPPFVVGPGVSAFDGGYRYRDSGLAGDEVSGRLVGGMPAHLTPGGTAQLLANWCLTAEQTWQERVSDWLDGRGCDAWIWQRELVEPGAYVAQWLADTGLARSSPDWSDRYDAWMQWFNAHRVLAIGMGLVSMRRTDSATVVVAEDVRQPVEQPVGAAIDEWLRRTRWLAEHDDTALLASRLYANPDLVLSVQSTLVRPAAFGSAPATDQQGFTGAGSSGWVPARTEVRQAGGVRWSVEVDAAMAAVIAASNGTVPVGLLLDLASAAAGQPLAPIATAALRDVVQRGLLSPFGPGAAPV